MTAPPLVFFDIDGVCKSFSEDDVKSFQSFNKHHFYWILTLEGVAIFSEQERPQLLKKGSLLVKEGPLVHQLKIHRRRSPWKMLCLVGTNKFTVERMRHVIQQNGRFQQISLNSDCFKLAQQLVASSQMDPWDRSLLAFKWFHAWWLEAERSKYEILNQLEEIPNVSNPSWHITSLKSLADQLGYSPSYLSDILAKKWKKSPARSLRKARLEYAAKRLRETSIRVGELSSELGYMSESSFVRAFRIYHGKPPEKYRKLKRGQVS